MPRNKTTSASVDTDGQTHADHERPPTPKTRKAKKTAGRANKGTDGQTDADPERPPTPKKGRGKKTAGRANKETTKSTPAQDSVVANTRTDADIEIAELKAQLAEAQRLQKEAEGQIAKVAPPVMKEDDHQGIVTIQKPKGEAGDKKNGFNLRTAMQLGDAAQKDLYDAIQRSIRTNAIRAGLDFTADYRRQDPAKLANVFKMTRKDHPYMTKKRFPADWCAAELLKQYLKNHRRHAVRNGRMESRAERRTRVQDELRNVDHSDSDHRDDDVV